MPYDLIYGRFESSKPRVWKDILLLVIGGIVFLITRRPEDRD